MTNNNSQDPSQKEDLHLVWKKQLFEKVKVAISLDALDWDHFSKQVDGFVHTFGGGLYREKRLPPHGRNEIWLPGMLEREIIKNYIEAMKSQQEK